MIYFVQFSTPLLQSRTSTKITVQSLIAENLVIDKSNQTAIWHVKRSKKAHTSAFIHFLQKCSIVKLEETMLRFSTFFRLPSKTNALLMLLLTSFVVILPWHDMHACVKAIKGKKCHINKSDYQKTRKIFTTIAQILS